MARITKTADERKREIVASAAKLFGEIGYANCSVEAIIRDVGIAKGTFYHHFKSKGEILSAIVDQTLDRLIEMVEQVAEDPSLAALDKMRLLLSGSHIGEDDSIELAEMLHLPENRELHEVSNIQTVLRLSPLLANIVTQGNREGVFACAHPLATVQFLLTGTQFLLDGGLFSFSTEERRLRQAVAQDIIEKALGATSGSFYFMTLDP